MNNKQKNSILKQYLGASPAWFDLRKKTILEDNIDINQWQINMNYLINKYGSIDSSEHKAYDDFISKLERQDDEFDIFDFEEDLEKKVTPVLLNILDADLPPILYNNQDRNWFLAAYPDVFEYFYPQPNLFAEDFDNELIRHEKQVIGLKELHKKLEQYSSQLITNQTTQLFRIKDFYKKELNKNFLLCTD